MSVTSRLAIPFLVAGQAQKEVTHNEALQMLDTLTQAAVEEGPRTNPPASPAVGASFIVAAGATGEWAGKSGQLATMTAGGWRYFTPVEGLSVHVKSADLTAAYVNGAWETGVIRAANVTVGGNQVVGARQAAITAPSGGATVDSESRAAITSILAALRAHGLIAT